MVGGLGERSLEVGFRTAQLRNHLRALRLPGPDVRAGIAALQAEGGTGEPGIRPVFVLGAGWRTGSTLLQRMLNGTGDLLIWGEPYSEGAIVQRLGESLSFLDPSCGRFHGRTLPDGDDVPSSDTWIANLTPTVANLVAAQRTMLDRLFGVPARRHGCERWGIKEVVWGRAEIDLLRLLYPDARFVLLVRDPLRQWQSYRPVTRRPWFLRWPERPIGSPAAFGRMWRRLADEFLAAERDIPDAVRLVRYEDLNDRAALGRVAAFLGVGKLVADAPAVGSSSSRRFFTVSVPSWEKRVIRRLTAGPAGRLGYDAEAVSAALPGGARASSLAEADRP